MEHSEQALAIFLLTDPERVVVIDDHCPHAGGSLSAGDVKGNKVSCPWHHWEFNLDTGACTDPPEARLRRYPAEIRNGVVWADLDGEPSSPTTRQLHAAASSNGMMNTLVKVCGITSAEDAEYALQAGADWIGLNLVGGTREIDLARLRRILARLDDPSPVVVLVPLEEGRIPNSLVSTLRDHGVRRLQVYGELTPDTVRDAKRIGFEIIVVWSIASDDSLAELADVVAACGAERPDYLLFDAAVPGKLGGTGKRADWQAIARARDGGLLDDWPPFILAGGLTLANVAEAIRTLSPAGVDVSSGVESRSGRKDHEMIAEFLAAVRDATTGERL